MALILAQLLGSIIGMYTNQQFIYGVNIFSDSRIFMMHMKKTILPCLLASVPSSFIVVLIIENLRKKNKRKE
ncbi:hypothetical protein [Romboutsia maritimum]|uniref:hypothetical protein n=1 Tax=Romboutsia maritimum TaxID=2020948 RepID=UPI001314DD21|nr:hypothetical protein [Romboutsia maritimum]